MDLTFNEIIKTIGKAVGKNLIVRKTVEVHSTMKIIKTFTGELYEINKGKGELIERFTKTDKVSTTSLENFQKKFDLYIIQEIIKLVLNGELSIK